MSVIVTPNMGLTLPVPGSELGPQYASDNNGSFTSIDGHDHTPGQGVPITPAGLNINSDLSLNGNNLILANSIEYVNLSAPLAGSSPFLNTTYFANGNFYVNDGAGNQIKITSAGNVNATASGISSGTATASFAGGVLVVDQNVNTPGDIQAGSIFIGNNVPGSSFAKVQAPSSLGADYSLTLPPTNSTGSTAFVTIDTSNNMGEGPAVTGGLTTANFAPSVNNALNPPGAITMFGGTSAPTGWFICDGSAVSRTTYSDLFAAIGTNYGVGDTTTTFNLPDFRGIFPRGVDNGAGNDPNSGTRSAVNGGNSGDNVGSLQTAATGQYGIGLSDPGHNHTERYFGAGGGGSSPALAGTSIIPTNFGIATASSSTGISLSGFGSETRPINLYVNFIIKT